MADPLVADLLGPPRFARAATPVACSSRKAVALLAYVLLSGRRHSRRELATLFWGHSDPETARASLRAALHRLPAAMAVCLAVDRDSISPGPAAEFALDVHAFEALASAENLDALERAASLYRDELLKDLEADATPEFDDWLHAERVRLSQVAQKVFEAILVRRADRARGDAARAAAEREAAIASGTRWVTLMPGSETAHRWLMRIYLDAGRRDAALEQYELCQRFLAVNHGRAPSPETRALFDQAQQGTTAPTPRDDPSTTARDAAPAATAVPITSFVGRLEELAELDRLLGEPGCRLITLHGLGGTGKTRLAHALTTHAGRRFSNGVAWVPLEDVTQADALPGAIATALRVDLPPTGSRADRIAAALARQSRLVVLDNFETLLGAGEWTQDTDPLHVVLTILAKAPGVRILVTSREVLGLQEEWVYEVRGLAYASGDAGTTAASLPAVELFAQRARQAYLGFSLPAELPHVLRICGLVEGLPLGIELAAAWVRTVPSGEIAAAIEREAASLRTTHRNRPERHGSLDAVIAYSWNLLAAEQREVLARLGLFAGGFTRDAGERVADASLRVLSTLVDKSLVRRNAEGRYDLHSLVRQFALARLSAKKTQATAATRRYVDYFATAVLDIAAQAQTSGEIAALARLKTELANVLAAWNGALAGARQDAIERMAAPLIALLHTGAMVPAALAEASRVAGALAGRWRGDVEASTRLQWGRAAITGGDPTVATRELDHAVTLARSVGRRELLARCLAYQAAGDYQRGDLDAGERAADEALELARDSDDADLRCIAHNTRGSLANMRSQFGVAETHLRLALACARETGSPSRVATILCSLAVPLYYRGQLDEAAALTQEAAAIFESIGRQATATTVRSNLAAIQIARGEHGAAEREVVHAVQLARETGDVYALVGALTTQGDILLRCGRCADARAAAEESLRCATTLESPLHVTEAHYVLARIDLREGEPDGALAHIIALRDALAQRRLLVRVPMLILASAEWAVAAEDEGVRSKGERWLRGLAQLSDIDSTLRDIAAARVAEYGDATPGTPVGDAGGDVTLAALEAEVFALLAATTRGTPA